MSENDLNSNKLGNWKSVVRLSLTFQATCSVDSDRDLTEQLLNVFVEFKSKSEYFKVQNFDYADGTSFSEDGNNYQESTFNISLEYEANALKLDEFENIVFEDIRSAKFAFTKSRNIAVTFHDIDYWEFYDLNKDSENPSNRYLRGENQLGVPNAFESKFLKIKNGISDGWRLEKNQLIWFEMSD